MIALGDDIKRNVPDFQILYKLARGLRDHWMGHYDYFKRNVIFALVIISNTTHMTALLRCQQFV
jgi:hypothetical protein